VIDSSSRFDTIRACDGQTDGRMDRRTHDDSIYRGRIASRGKSQSPNFTKFSVHVGHGRGSRCDTLLTVIYFRFCTWRHSCLPIIVWGKATMIARPPSRSRCPPSQILAKVAVNPLKNFTASRKTTRKRHNSRLAANNLFSPYSFFLITRSVCADLQLAIYTVLSRFNQQLL